MQALKRLAVLVGTVIDLLVILWSLGVWVVIVGALLSQQWGLAAALFVLHWIAPPLVLRGTKALQSWGDPGLALQYKLQDYSRALTRRR